MILPDFEFWLKSQHACQQRYFFGDNSDFAQLLRQYLAGESIDNDMVKWLAAGNFDRQKIQKELGENVARQELIDAFVKFFQAIRSSAKPKTSTSAGDYLARDGAKPLHEAIEAFNQVFEVDKTNSLKQTTGYWIVYDMLAEWLNPQNAVEHLRSATVPVVFHRPADSQNTKRTFLLWLSCYLEPAASEAPGLAVPRLIDFGLTDICGILQPIADAWQVSGLQDNYRCVWQIREHHPDHSAQGFIRFPDALDGTSLQAAFLTAVWAAAGEIPGEDAAETRDLCRVNTHVIVSAPVDIESAKTHSLQGRQIPLLPVGDIVEKFNAIRSFMNPGDENPYFNSSLFCDKNCDPARNAHLEDGLRIDRSCRNMGDVLAHAFSLREWKRLLGRYSASTWETKWCNVHDRYGQLLGEGQHSATAAEPAVSTGSLQHTTGGAADYVGAHDSVNPEDEPAAKKKVYSYPPEEWFIHDQAWFEFATVVDKPAEQLRQILGSDEQPLRGGDDQWKRLDTHNELAVEPELSERQSIILAAVAGAGKTVASEWIEYRFNQQDCPKVAFRFRTHEFAAKLSNAGPTFQNFLEVIATEWKRRVEMVAPEKAAVCGSEVKAWLASLLKSEKLCLILDALDEASDEQVLWLEEFMMRNAKELQRCRLVVAGRPRALAMHSHIFEQRKWKLIRVSGFNQKQQIKYLGWLPDGALRYFALPQNSHHLLSNPRFLSFLRHNDKVHKDMRPTGLLYSSLTEVLLLTMQNSEAAAMIGRSEAAQSSAAKTAFRVDESQVKLALQMLAILVYECVKQNLAADGADQAFADIFSTRRGEETAASLKDRVQKNLMRKRGKGVEPVRTTLGFEKSWTGLAALNPSFLKDCEFADTGDLIHFGWSSTEIGEYLLAYYFSALACDENRNEDCGLLGRLISLSHSHSPPALRNFWLFLCTMNDESRKAVPWLQSIEVLYTYERDPQGATERWQLASELIVRSMQQLKQYCGNKATELGAAANKIYDDWSSRFNEILQGKHGQEKQSVAQQLIERRHSALAELPFVKLCAGAGEHDNGRLAPGGDREAEVTIAPFALQRLCVTNLQFELFDPLHRALRDFDNSDQYPVTQVSLFDAWCFAEWLGEVEAHDGMYRFRLPTPDELEYACRCGEVTQYTWHDRKDGDECRYSWCHFDASSLGVKYHDKVLGRPIAVDGIDGDVQVLPNPWGFYQLHGNVWEWCLADGAFSKTEAYDQGIARGGSWNMDASACRSSNAGNYEAGTHSDDIGFRLAMDPVRGAGA